MKPDIVYEKRRRKFLIPFLLALVLFFVLIFLYYFYVVSVPASSIGEEKQFIIESGQSSTQISENLEKEGVVKDARIFEFYAWTKGLDDKLQTGTFELNSSQNIKEVLSVLTAIKRRNENQFTIIEGWSNKEISEMFEKNGIMQKEEFEAGTIKKNSWREEYDFLSEKPRDVDLEGYLFPDTYRVFHDASPETVLRRILDNFNVKITSEMRADAKKQGKTLHEIITLASILEREVILEKDRKIVAGIFYKRLNIGMALQADSTVNYVTGKKRAAASFEDLEVDSPYNTYKYRGLPPGPISNPGLSSIIGAIYPEDSEYLFFLTTPEGEVIYSKTFEEHVDNKNKYLR